MDLLSKKNRNGRFTEIAMNHDPSFLCTNTGRENRRLLLSLAVIKKHRES